MKKITIEGKKYTKAKGFKTKSEAKKHAKYIKSFRPKMSVRVKEYKVGNSKRYGVYTK